METLKVGDVVRLKSGGPIMTINGTENTKFVCQWLIDNKVYEELYPVDSLELSAAHAGFSAWIRTSETL